jgi:hypothetical protein
MWKIWKLEQQLVTRCLHFSNFLVEFGNLITDLPRLLLSPFGFVGLLLRHQGANFPGNFIPLRLKLLDLRQAFSPLLIQCQRLPDSRLVPCPAAGEPFANVIRLFANRSDV